MANTSLNNLRAEPTKAARDGLLAWLRDQIGSAADLATLDSSSILVQAADLIRDSADAVTLQIKQVAIDDWNMVADPTKAVAHGITLSKIIAIWGYVRNDGDTLRFPFGASNGSSQVTMGVRTDVGSVGGADSTNITLIRTTGSSFDSTEYNATTYNRGHIYILHTP